MRFSIPKLLQDVKKYELSKKKLEQMQQKPKHWWSKKYTQEEIEIQFQDYVSKMRKLEENYNPNYFKNLRKQCIYNNSPIKMLPSAPPIDMIC